MKRDEGKQTTQPDPAAVRAAERWDRGAFADDPTYGHTLAQIIDAEYRPVLGEMAEVIVGAYPAAPAGSITGGWCCRWCEATEWHPVHDDWCEWLRAGAALARAGYDRVSGGWYDQ